MVQNHFETSALTTCSYHALTVYVAGQQPQDSLDAAAIVITQT
jgi:hypothetical protein